MRAKKLLTSAICIQFGLINLQAQTGADYLNAYKITTCTIPFDINAEGKPFYVNWGMDAAWDWDVNVNRGIAHIGKGNFATGRVSFQPNDLVTDNGDGTYTLSARQQTKLKWRCDLMKLTGTKDVNINCDHEALFKDGDKDDYTGRTNYQGKPKEWYKLIKASVQFVQKQGLNVISVSPFNEPDYVWEQAKNETQAMADFLAIAKLIKEDDFFKDIRISGGNTLNCDRALPWYNYLKNYIDEGNTHQLAGSLANYSNFFSTVVKDGKLGTGDELHNVGEAIVGVNYGMTSGIWWGFDSRARGQFCIDSNEGVRLGYAEDGSSWTSGAVYRNDKTKEIHAFIGSSERQATNASYRFVSTAKDVYFNGYGPCREYVVDIPGGTGYQKGQINAEKLIDITYGEDVPQAYINGTYTIFNLASKRVLALPSSSSSNGTKAQILNRKAGANQPQQEWVVTPKNIDGDCSYWTITLNTGKNMQLDLLNWNLKAGAEVIAWENENPGGNEQWYLKYAGNGYWYIINRYNNKALYAPNSNVGTACQLGETPTSTTLEAVKKKYMWRFQPTDATADTNAPKWGETTISTTSYIGSIKVNWTAIEDTTVTYNVLRAEKSDGAFNTIARSLKSNSFIDNNAILGTKYIYKVVPVSYNGTRGNTSDTATAKTKEGKALIAQYQFDKSMSDNSVNEMTASINNTPSYAASLLKKSGTSALNLAAQSSYVEIPLSLTNLDAMTIATWVRWSGKSSWERIFDFGNSTNQYMFLTPSNGSEMRFVMKNNGDEQILSATKLSTVTYRHLAVTINPLENGYVEVKLYLDGEEVASSDKFTIKPSDIAPVLNYIGRSQFDADKLFAGYIDDFRIYNYALNADEVKAITTDLDAASKDLEDPTTAITSVYNSNSSKDAYYNINGVKTSSLQKGINIIKHSDGSTTKIFK